MALRRFQSYANVQKGGYFPRFPLPQNVPGACARTTGFTKTPIFINTRAKDPSLYIQFLNDKRPGLIIYIV